MCCVCVLLATGIKTEGLFSQKVSDRRVRRFKRYLRKRSCIVATSHFMSALCCQICCACMHVCVCVCVCVSFIQVVLYYVCMPAWIAGRVCVCQSLGSYKVHRVACSQTKPIPSKPSMSMRPPQCCARCWQILRSRSSPLNSSRIS